MSESKYYDRHIAFEGLQSPMPIELRGAMVRYLKAEDEVFEAAVKRDKALEDFNSAWRQMIQEDEQPS